MKKRRQVDKRWVTMVVLCMGALMIVLDTTIINVALPSIRQDLGFTEASLAWVVNAYLLTFGGFLLLGGRLGDMFGHRRLFLTGLVIFTGASLVCGLSRTQSMLVIMRAIQGIGGAIVSAVGLSLMMNLFTTPKDRAKAMGVYGFVGAGGGAVGVLLGGVLTGTLSWHWIFLVNIPLGILVFVLSLMLVPKTKTGGSWRHLDVLGAITVTAALLLAVYAVVNGNAAGWLSKQTIGLLTGAALLLALFTFIELRVKHPLIPLRLFLSRNVTIANIIGILWAAAMFAWFFLSALYMQLVLHYSPLRIGLSFLPSNLIMAALSVGVSAWLVMRLGIKQVATAGMVLVMLGLLWFARAPVDGNFWIDILPSMLLLGVGAGVALNPVLLAAMNDVPKKESGLASGLVNTSFMMGGALGLAVLASVAASRNAHLLTTGASTANALTSGYHYAFLVGAAFAGIAALLAAFGLRKTTTKKNRVHAS